MKISERWCTYWLIKRKISVERTVHGRCVSGFSCSHSGISAVWTLNMFWKKIMTYFTYDLKKIRSLIVYRQGFHQKRRNHSNRLCVQDAFNEIPALMDKKYLIHDKISTQIIKMNSIMWKANLWGKGFCVCVFVY